VEALYREEETLLARARLEDAAKKEAFFLQGIETLDDPPSERPAQPESQVFRIAHTYAQKRDETPEPTTLLMLDEAGYPLKAGQLGVGHVI
jgi:hypothetical protein